jgi:hypothetical protein
LAAFKVLEVQLRGPKHESGAVCGPPPTILSHSLAGVPSLTTDTTHEKLEAVNSLIANAAYGGERGEHPSGSRVLIIDCDGDPIVRAYGDPVKATKKK